MKNKKIRLSILGILGLVIITTGVTYAFFNYTKQGTTENSITIGTVEFLYTEVDKVGAGISIEDALPTTDEVGKAQTGSGNIFNFKITANTKGKVDIPYEVTARKKSSSTLDEEAVRVYLTEIDGTEKELLLDNYDNLTQTSKISSDVAVEKTIYTGRVPSGQTNYEKNFRLRMWLDSSVDFSDGSYNGKTFTLTVNVYANATVVTDNQAILDDDSITKYNSVNEVLAAIPTDTTKDVIACDYLEKDDLTLYYNCNNVHSLVNSMTNKTKQLMILNRDIEVSSITVDSNQNIILDLNGKTITTNYGLKNYGITTINDNVGTGKLESVNQAVNNSGSVLTINGGSYNRSTGVGTAIYNEGVGKLVINGGTFTNTSTGSAVQNRLPTSTEDGTIEINGGSFTTNGVVIGNYKGITSIKNASIISNNTSNVSAVYNRNNLNIYDGTQIEGPYGIGGNGTQNYEINIYGGTITGNKLSAIAFNTGDYSGIANIYGGIITGTNNGIYFGSDNGTLNIYGGTYTSNGRTFENHSAGTININQSTKPIHISSTAQTWLPAIITTVADAKINITANRANKCTGVASDTTSGLCVYAEGTKNWSSNTANTAVSNGGNETSVNGPTININGGTYFGGYVGIGNHYNGIMNIKNADINSGMYAILIARTGVTNICNSTIASSNYSLFSQSESTGKIYYGNSNVFTSGNIGGDTSNIIANDNICH